MVDTLGCALCSNVITRKAFEWGMLPMYFGEVPCSERLKAVFNDEQGYKLDSLPGCKKRSSSKGCKIIFFFCCLLTQLYLHLKFPDLILPLFLFFKLSVLPALLLAWVSLHHTVVICLLITCGWKTSTVRSDVAAPWPCQAEEGSSRPPLISQKSSPVVSRESFPQPWLGVNPLPWAQHKNAPFPILALLWGQSALLSCILVQVPLDYSASRSCCKPFWSDGAGRDSTIGGAVIQPLAWVWAN